MDIAILVLLVVAVCTSINTLVQSFTTLVDERIIYSYLFSVALVLSIMVLAVISYA